MCFVKFIKYLKEEIKSIYQNIMDSIIYFLSSDSEDETEPKSLRLRQIRDKSDIYSLSDTE